MFYSYQYKFFIIQYVKLYFFVVIFWEANKNSDFFIPVTYSKSTVSESNLI